MGFNSGFKGLKLFLTHSIYPYNCIQHHWNGSLKDDTLPLT